MEFNKLTFERKTLPKDIHLNEDRPNIDFIIDGKSLNSYLGNLEDPVTAFGWGNNIDFELKNAEMLINFKKSKFGNGLQSDYVCACCGDEGCGAIMFEVVKRGNYVEWRNFVKSDGYPCESEPDEQIDINSFKFEFGNYSRAIGKLHSMIRQKE